VGRFDYLPNRFPDLNFVLSGLEPQHREHFYSSTNGGHIRIGRYRWATRVARNQGVDNIFLPPIERLIMATLESAGYSVDRDEKGMYYKGVKELIGSFEDIAFIRDERVRRLIDEMCSGKPYAWEQVQRISKFGNEPKKLKELLLFMVEHQLMFRGLELRCPNCYLRTWYDIDDFGEGILCHGCKTLYQLPVDFKLRFSYRLNQLLIRAFEAGALTVFLTALLLRELSTRSFLWDAGYLVERNGEKSDIDLVAICDEILIVSECKDNFENNIAEQLRKSVDVAQQIGADIFLFSSMLSQDEIPADVKQLLSELNKSHKLAVRLITGDELARGFIELPDKSRHAELGDLLKLPQYVNATNFEPDPIYQGPIFY
jgi:Holliday junction resolvase